MTANLTARGLLLLVAVAGAVGSWYLHRGSTSDRLQTAALRHRTAELRQELSPMRKRIGDAQAAESMAKRAKAASERKPTPVQAPKRSFLELSRTNPKVQALMLEHERSGLLIEYGPWLHQYVLDDDRARKFIANIVAQRAAQMDLRAALLAKRLDQNAPEARKLYAEQASQCEAEQRELLGDTTFAALKVYEQEKAARIMLDGIAGASVLAGVPITREQITQLVGSMNTYPIDWAKADERAKEILTPEQFALFTSTEALGPLGYGWRFQYQLNESITRGDEQDRTKTASSAGP